MKYSDPSEKVTLFRDAHVVLTTFVKDGIVVYDVTFVSESKSAKSNSGDSNGNGGEARLMVKACPRDPCTD